MLKQLCVCVEEKAQLSAVRLSFYPNNHKASTPPILKNPMPCSDYKWHLEGMAIKYVPFSLSKPLAPGYCSCLLSVPPTSYSPFSLFCTLCLKAITLQLGLQGLMYSGSDDLPNRLIIRHSHHALWPTQQAWATRLNFPYCQPLSTPDLSLLLWPFTGLFPPPGEDKDCVIYIYIYEFSLSTRRVLLQIS